MKEKHMPSLTARLGIGVVSLTATLLLIGTVPNPSPVLAKAEEKQEVKKDKKVSYREDFYEAVNGDYLKKVKLDPGEVTDGVANEASSKIDDRLESLIQDYMDADKKDLNHEQKQLLAYYDLAYDFKRRDKEGAKPVQAYLKKIEALSDSQALSDQLVQWMKEGRPLPFSVQVTAGLKDPTTNQVLINSGDLILPDTSYYKKGHKKAAQLLKVFESSTTAMLEKMGYSKKVAEKHVKGAIAYDELMASFRTPSEKRRKSSENMMEVTPGQVHEWTDTFSLMDVMEKLLGKNPQKINVDDLMFAKGLKTLMSQEHFAQLKSWILVKQAREAAPYLSDDISALGEKMDLAQQGLSDPTDKESKAFGIVTDQFSDVLSVDYGKKYFGEKAKQDVQGMVDKLIAIYKKRLAKTEWLSPETRQKAIEKMDKMTSLVGYPDMYSDLTSGYQIDPHKSFFENTKMMQRLSQASDFEGYGEKADRGSWEMNSYEVNAYYSSNDNLICLPAGMLQAPYYDPNRSASANWGGIGATIGHELSHAFDPDGAEYDADGALKDWWKEEDYKAFQERTKRMVAQFDGIKIYGGKVDGKFTLAENIADNGGLAVTLVAMKDEKNPDYKAYFKSYARSWATKSRKAYANSLLVLDEHAPDKLRTNIPITNFDEFYETFGVKKGDPMYRDPKDRIIFW
ncbi:M13 family peptidase [Atopobacter sp. AH10]|uniref:M13-type metalloendopeptidase n=1 Tax=Atopobacter sp. AH10 TaxID=2315861 RepID=UPI000EF26907|nr:M13 family metallopeptidase [Atopobacter sp. AH10]RLK63772.1 M13 family peptidase [Atopobacter sp. AH10]